MKQAMGYLTAGKRDLLIQDPASAVASLAQACQLLGDHYGETAPECGEPYYYYGRALLDLARMEAGVIDNVLDGGKPFSLVFSVLNVKVVRVFNGNYSNLI